jgi:hypothetical protein
VGEHDVALLELRHQVAHGEHLAHGGVAGIDLSTPGLGDVDRVGQGCVVHVVLGRGCQDAQVDVARAHGPQLQRVELDDAGDVELVEVAPHPLALGGDVFGPDRVGTHGHRGLRFRVSGRGHYGAEPSGPQPGTVTARLAPLMERL